MRRPFLTLALVGCSLVGAGRTALAQDVATLDQVEELAAQGRTEEARDALTTWWTESVKGATRREVQRGLWLRGRLTVDPTQAATDFRRLVIEYPGGPYSDQALFRLAQAAYAAGDSLGAVAQVQRLVREYPGSAARREAEAWLATAGPAPPAVAPAAGTLPDADTAPVTTTPAGPFTVQLGAFSALERAEAVQRRAVEAGFEARLVTVPGSALIRVRVGAFEGQETAESLLGRLQELGFTVALARDADRETPVVR